MSQQYTLSFEVFPPKTDTGAANLLLELDKLSAFRPDYISVTYGAGGSTREKTLEIARKIKDRGNEVLVHFTCVGASKTQIAEYLSRVHDAGFNNILALRGDPPRDALNFVPHPDGFSYANELVTFLKERGDFHISVAGYPEGHPEASSLDFDIDMLKRKIDAGAQRVITQLFFDNDDFERFLNKCTQKGVKAPLVPGIMPVRNMPQLERVVSLSNAKVPSALREVLEGSDENSVCTGALDYAAAQIDGLRTMGISAFHLYPLNKADGIEAVIRGGGIR